MKFNLIHNEKQITKLILCTFLIFLLIDTAYGFAGIGGNTITIPIDSSVPTAGKEIGIIENTQVINIIDSVVQRTNFEMGDGGNAQVNIRDSVVQRSKIGKE